MAVIRIEKNRNYTIMSNYHLRDTNLSLKAKGLLSIMLSLPEGWHYNVRGLASICKEGISSVSSALKELETCGYMKRFQPIADGKFQEIEYIIYETPQDHLIRNHSTDSNYNPDLFADAIPAEPEDSFVKQFGSREPLSAFPHPLNPDTENPCTENLNTGNTYTENEDPFSANTSNAHTANRHAYKRKTKGYTERSKTVKNNYPSINHGTDGMDGSMGNDPISGNPMNPSSASLDEFMQGRKEYRQIIEKNIRFEELCVTHPCQKQLIEGIVSLMVETVCSNAETIHIDQQDIPQQVVKSRFLKLNSRNIEYVLTCFEQQNQRIKRIDRYLLTMLYKAPDTQDAFYTNWVNSSLYSPPMKGDPTHAR